MAASRGRFQIEGSAEDEVHFRITVFGAVGVGKSSIISQFVHQGYSSVHRKTIEDLYRTHLDIEGTHFTLDILDTAGHGEFIGMRKLAIATSDAFVLVFSKVDRYSFDTVERLRTDILAQRGNVPIVIVENKSDIKSENTCPDVTDTKILEAVVCLDWESSFIQTSAKDDINIKAVFQEVLRLSNKQKKAKGKLVIFRPRLQSEGGPSGEPVKRRKDGCRMS